MIIQVKHFEQEYDSTDGYVSHQETQKLGIVAHASFPKIQSWERKNPISKVSQGYTASLFCPEIISTLSPLNNETQ